MSTLDGLEIAILHFSGKPKEQDQKQENLDLWLGLPGFVKDLEITSCFSSLGEMQHFLGDSLPLTRRKCSALLLLLCHYKYKVRLFQIT